MLESIFGSRTRVKLLKIFLAHPGEYYFVRELARMTEEKIKAIRRELSNLEEFGLIMAEKKVKFENKALSQPARTVQTDLKQIERRKFGIGKVNPAQERKKYYTVNINFILYNEFKNLILKSRLLLEKSLAK